jgi:DNA-binding NtrC family response regulator
MSQRKILIVDDEAPIREMLEMAFGKAGYLVRLAAGAYSGDREQ